jgi:hypothetical protein
VEPLLESEASIRARRRRRTTLTLTVVAVLMLGTFAFAGAYYQGWIGGGSTSKPVANAKCQRTGRAQPSGPKAVTVNVYNATDRTGLAASVAKSLRTQGFKIAKVTNDPLGKSIRGVGEVRHGRMGAGGATLAAARLRGAKVVSDRRTDATVDLVLGNRFTALSAPARVSPPNVSTPTPSC